MVGPSEEHQLATTPALIGDIGATNARFALVGGTGAVERIRVLACEDYATLDGAIGAYLDEGSGLTGSPELRLRTIALAVAGPVAGDQVALTNRRWSFSISELRRRLAVDRLLVVNDFMAVALATPHLKLDERRAVGGGTVVPNAPIGVLGAGSGLGVSGLVPKAGQWLALPSEGGHVTMAPATTRESVVLERMRQRLDHVSAERVLSGLGLVNLYKTLAEIDRVPTASYTPAQIADPAIGQQDPHCREALNMFCAMLGTIAGNLALTLGARGGIYIAGGIVPKLGAVFATSEFRKRFENKGRLRSYLAGIPTYVVMHPFPAFVGLTTLLAQDRD